MQIYKDRYELVNPSFALRNDFFSFYDMGLVLKRSLIKIDRQLKEKLFPQAILEYNVVISKMSNMMDEIYMFMREGDRMKKQEAYLVSLEDGEILEDDQVDVEIPGEPNTNSPTKSKNKSKKKEEETHTETFPEMYFNILNVWLGNTKNYE